jgi:hypothetical protein
MNARDMPSAPSAPRRRWWPWSMLWVLAAVGHSLGNVSHPQPPPIPQPVPIVAPAPVPHSVPQDDPFDRATAEVVLHMPYLALKG